MIVFFYLLFKYQFIIIIFFFSNRNKSFKNAKHSIIFFPKQISIHLPFNDSCNEDTGKITKVERQTVCLNLFLTVDAVNMTKKK